MRTLSKLCVIIRVRDLILMIRTYTELAHIPDYKERFEYLKLDGSVGVDTFGHDRYLNQVFYRSKEWKKIRDEVIIRDNGCDLGIEGYEIYGRIYIHHMNPIYLEDLESRSAFLLNPEYLICVTHMTHNAIHYGDESLLILPPTERSKNDTCPWKK